MSGPPTRNKTTDDTEIRHEVVIATYHGEMGTKGKDTKGTVGARGRRGDRSMGNEDEMNRLTLMLVTQRSRRGNQRNGKNFALSKYMGSLQGIDCQPGTAAGNSRETCNSQTTSEPAAMTC
jgi:hypothetical protein